MADQTSWTIGELARAAGVTVRTLHHYDQLGLLCASARSEGGHRRYDADDVARLYRILALRSLGLSLEELTPLLDEDNDGRLRATVDLQRGRVAEQLDHFTQLQARLEAVAAGLDGNREPPTTQLLDTLEAMTMTVQLNRIYTRLGDDGQTNLADRSRVSKTDARVEAVGTIDELNAAIGLTLASAGEVPERVSGWLRRIQNDLFDLSAILNRPGQDDTPDSPITESDVAWLESVCDEANAGLPSLTSFVVPGGTPLGAHLHLCRVVCRRAERRVLAISQAPIWPARYLNRLSDALFILSRLANRNRDEPLWQRRFGETGVSSVS